MPVDGSQPVFFICTQLGKENLSLVLFKECKRNYHFSMPKENSRGRAPNRGRSEKKKQKSSEAKPSLQGFQTLSQVSGAPLKSVHHSRIPVAPVKSVREPHTICPICGQKINLISEALTDPKGEYVHFDCVIKQLRERYRPRENQTISYVGRGNFALCEKGADGKWSIVERIQYESGESVEKLRSYVESLKG